MVATVGPQKSLFQCHYNRASRAGEAGDELTSLVTISYILALQMRQKRVNWMLQDSSRGACVTLGHCKVIFVMTSSLPFQVENICD